ncbi:MAG TPA: class I SAM-dependent methyltransferase [Oceanithermus profundus]|uniref:Class I SAM-dependent methyltransferase n=1 Tax=Oceanithermus profundus TaxID=187137 RepID=A0A7C4ZFC7_9DEIN|nr:class I SAM-dependent methyltransferase [Oceanithermus profundus]
MGGVLAAQPPLDRPQAGGGAPGGAFGVAAATQAGGAVAHEPEKDVYETHEVEAFYDASAEAEWSRLERHRTEFAVTLRALEEHLPPPPAAVLDVGGGPGRYAIELTRRGYRVTLVDLSAANLELARAKANEAGIELEDVIQANALDLGGLADAAYDAVLLMGPLYHLTDEDARRLAVRQARRKLRAGGVIFAAFIARFAPMRDLAARDPGWAEGRWDYLERLLQTGVHDSGEGFTVAYFAHPDEIEPLMEAEGFATLGVLGCEGVVAGHEDKINALAGEAWARWVDLNYRLGQDPALWGASDHLLYVGRKT